MIDFGHLVQLIALESKDQYFFVLTPEGALSTHLGIIHHEKIHSLNYGEEILSHTGVAFLILRPSLYDVLMKVKRKTQIIYPKDIGYLLLKLGVRNGDRVVEVGTGSGCLSIALAYALAPEGRLTSYEAREEFSLNAKSNLEMAGIDSFVTLKVRDIGLSPLDETQVDAVFIDVKDPVAVLPHAFAALKVGGNIGFLLPTTNQICSVIEKLEEIGFCEIEALELLERFFKINPARLRPTDRMVAHTAYLLFAKKAFKKTHFSSKNHSF